MRDSSSQLVLAAVVLIILSFSIFTYSYVPASFAYDYSPFGDNNDDNQSGDSNSNRGDNRGDNRDRGHSDDSNSGDDNNWGDHDHSGDTRSSEGELQIVRVKQTTRMDLPPTIHNLANLPPRKGVIMIIQKIMERRII